MAESEPENKINFSEQTTLHGVHEMMEEKNIWMKGCWMLLLITGYVVMIYYVQGVSNDYISQPTSASMQPSSPGKLPVITYCPNPWVSHPRALDLGFDRDMYLAFLGAFTGMEAKLKPSSAPKNLATATERILALGLTIDEIVDKIGLTSSEVITQISLFMDQLHFPISVIARVMKMSGSCFAFEVDQPINTMEVNTANLKVLIQHHLEPFGPLEPVDTSCQASEVGCRSESHDQVDDWYFGEDGLGLLSGNTLSVQRYFDAEIRLNAGMLFSLTTRAHPCKNISAVTRHKCVMANINNPCYQISTPLYIHGFGFKFSEVSNIWNQSKNCLNEIRQKSMEEVDQFYDVCDRECDRQLIDMSIMQPLKMNEDNISSISFKFANPRHGRYTQEYYSYTGDTFIGSLGGQISLWSGASVITVAQLMCLGYQRAKYRLLENRNAVQPEMKY